MRLSLTGVTRRAVVGKLSKDGTRYIGTMHDVHNDFIAAVLDFCEMGKKEQHITINGKPAYVVKVVKVDEERGE